MRTYPYITVLPPVHAGRPAFDRFRLDGLSASSRSFSGWKLTLQKALQDLSVVKLAPYSGQKGQNCNGQISEVRTNEKFAKEPAMADKVEVCMCEKCGNEVEMTISCQWTDVQTPYGEILKQQKETRTCKVCGNEAETIIDLGD